MKLKTYEMIYKKKELLECLQNVLSKRVVVLTSLLCIQFTIPEVRISMAKLPNCPILEKNSEISECLLFLKFFP